MQCCLCFNRCFLLRYDLRLNLKVAYAVEEELQNLKTREAREAIREPSLSLCVRV